MEALAGGEQLPGHAEVDLRAGDAAAQEVVEAHGTDSGAQGVLFGVGRCSAGVGSHGESEAVVFQGSGQPGAPAAGGAVGGNGYGAQLRGGSRAQCQVGQHLGAGSADERVVAVTEAVFQVSRARCFVVGIGSGRGERRLAGVQVVVDREEQVVVGPHGCSDQDGAVPVRAEDLAAGRELFPPLAELLEPHVAALGLNQPVQLLRLVVPPQVGQLLLRILEGLEQGGDGAAEFEVLSLAEA
ncbi:hypothetical protein ACFV8Z_46115 [Streptomyces sp. NPDC059837]|uniref:hypothetical protein n=1 Tax=unclassified Streptomyces TaxID=2593676 RepID=UPI0036690CD6